MTYDLSCILPRWRDEFEETAAFLEYQNNLSRRDAEYWAWCFVINPKVDPVPLGKYEGFYTGSSAATGRQTTFDNVRPVRVTYRGQPLRPEAVLLLTIAELSWHNSAA